MPTPTPRDLHIVANHLLVRDGDTFDLLDTGVPDTMDAPSMMSDQLGVPVRRLIGCAELARTPLRIDWTARTITAGATGRGAGAIRVPLRMSPLGVPLIPLDTETGFAEAVLDTGAALSYCPPEYVQGLQPLRHDEDFLPGHGRFAVEVHEATIEIMGVPLTLEVAVLPPLLRAALALIAPDGWILGSALFRDRVVTLDLARSRLLLGQLQRTGRATRPSRAERVDAHFGDEDADPIPDGFDDASEDAGSLDDATAPAEPQLTGEDAGVRYTVDLDATRLRSGDTRIRAAVTLRGAGTGEVERPVNLALVLDRSGSMSGTPIEAVREAASDLIARLPRGSRAAMVTFSNSAQVAFPLATIDESSLPACQSTIQSIDAAGATALEDGWSHGLSELAPNGDLQGAMHTGKDAADRQALALRRIVLMTDGHANIGERSPAVLAEMCRSAARRGVTTTTMGFGDGYDEDLLRAMADAGDGSTWYVQGPGRVGEVLDEELRAMRSVSALRVALEVVPGEATLTGVWGGLTGGGPLAGTDTPAARSVMVGELSAAADRPIVLEFTVPGERAARALQLAECVVTGVAPDGVTPVATRFSIEWNGVHAPSVTARVTWLELHAAAVRERAVALADARRFDEGAALLRRCLTLLDRQPPVLRDRLHEARRALEALLRRLQRGRLDIVDRKRELQHAYDRRTGKKMLFDW